MRGSFFNIRTLQVDELTRFNLPQLLRYEDRNSMAHSIEARVPFIEHRCIENAVAQDPKNKIRNGFTKHPLRILADKILPNEIAWRTNKIGFEAPDAIWLEQHLSLMNEAVNESIILKYICKNIPDLSKQPLGVRWKLYNLAVWEKQFNVAI
jgi:asparagine synthase (glutamine-hydrolysing)